MPVTATAAGAHRSRTRRADMRTGTVLLLALAAVASAVEIKLMVAEPEPFQALMLRAALEAGLRAAAEDERGEGDEGEEGDDGGEEEWTVLALPVDPHEVLDIPDKVCDAAEQSALAVVTSVGGEGGSGPAALALAAAVRAGVPLLLVGEGAGGRRALSLRPAVALALRAARDLAAAKGWARAALLHAGSARGATELDTTDDDGLKLFVRQLPPGDDDALLRDLLLSLKGAGFVNFIVCGGGGARGAVRVLDAALRVGLLGARHAYLVLDFDLHAHDLEPFSYGGANITALMFFDPAMNETRRATVAWRQEYQQRLWKDARAARIQGKEAGEEGEAGSDVKEEVMRARYTPENIPSALLLAYDAARLAARAATALSLPPKSPGHCADGRAAFHADTLLNYIRSEEHLGVTGVLSWDADGERQYVVLQVAELQRRGHLSAVGSWSERGGVTWSRPPVPSKPLPSDRMENRTFTVMIVISHPYIMRKVSTQKQTGNARYEGFGIELIERLAEMLHFNVTFVEQEGKDYGSINKTTGEWQGMLAAVKDDKENLTLAITDLTITELREQVVDFTTPFMNLGIAILFHKPLAPEPELFAFLLPFSKDVWAYLGLAYLGSSLFLYVVGRLCPEEWQNPYPCIEEPPALENQFTLGNALWFNLGAILLQGSEIAPVGYSTRAVASVWWVFALVITSSYTANLATLLAMKTNNEVIKDVNDLAYNQLGITYGAKKTGSTKDFLENSQAEIYKHMFEQMKQWPEVKDNDEGIDRAEKSNNFAFLMESTSIEYVVERRCDLYMVGDLLDSKGYGIAMRKGSPFRQELNLALLRLQEGGILREMKHVWWEERNGGGACKPVDDRESEPLRMNSLYGLYAVLVVGCAVGLLLSCGDLALAARRRPRLPHLSFAHNFWHELRFVFRFELSTKPLTGPLIPPKTPSIMSSEPEEIGPEDEGRGEGEGEGEEGEAGREEGARCESAQSAPRRRRRSSMHTASMKLVRHTHARHSDTPNTHAHAHTHAHN